KAARARDRPREQVLRDLGWNLHRIWGAAWHGDRDAEERRLMAAIEHAMAAPPDGVLGGATKPGEAARPAGDEHTVTAEADGGHPGVRDPARPRRTGFPPLPPPAP